MQTSQSTDTAPPGREIATLGGGCFWCLEAVFDELKGVEAVESGYMGGHKANPSYAEVCGGDTGHAEVVRITFDPQAVSFEEILDVFFAIHDPTQLNFQGNDVGTQYRSVIFYHSREQKTVAERVIAALEAGKSWRDPIVTEIAPASVFHIAEDYHQEYFELNPFQPYCRAVVAPKVAKFHKYFRDKIKKRG